MAEPSFMNILGMLPQLLFIAQVFTYLVLAWFFGSMSFRGMHRQVPIAIKIVATFGAGFLCLVSGTVLAGYMFFFEGTILQTFQIDMFLGGLIASVIIAIALHMITRKEKGLDKDSRIRKLQERIKLLKGILLRYNVPTLKEHDAMTKSETLVHGFKAKHASLKGANWEVFLEKGERKAKVIMSAYTGEVKKVEHIRTKGILSDPVRIIGVALIIFVVAFSLLNFRGFPDMMEGVASLLGMSPEQFSMFVGAGNLPEGCVSVTSLMTEEGIKVIGGENMYRNEEVEGMIEGESGFEIEWMYMVDYEGANYIIAVDSSLENVCSATEDKFCHCIKIPLL